MQWITDRVLTWKEIEVAIMLSGKDRFYHEITRPVNSKYLGLRDSNFLEICENQVEQGWMSTKDHPRISYEEALERIKLLS